MKKKLRKNSLKTIKWSNFLICILVTGVVLSNVFTGLFVNASIPENEATVSETTIETEMMSSARTDAVRVSDDQVESDSEVQGIQETDQSEMIEENTIVQFKDYEDALEMALTGEKSVDDILPDSLTAVYADGKETVMNVSWTEEKGFGDNEAANWVFRLDTSDLVLSDSLKSTEIPSVTITAYKPEYVPNIALFQFYSAKSTGGLEGSKGVLSYGDDQYLSYYNSSNYTRTYYVDAGGSIYSGFCSKASYYAPAEGGTYSLHEIPGSEKSGAIVKAMLITNPVYGPHKDGIWSTVDDGYLVADGKTFWNVHSALSAYWADDLWGTSSRSIAAIEEVGEYLYNTWIPEHQDIFNACHAYYLCSSSLEHTSDDKGARCPSGKQDILFVSDDYNPMRYLRIHKTFEGGNDSYNPDSDDAIYGIYTDAACTNAYVTPYLSGSQSQFRIESDGYTGHIPVEAGVYYIKEVKAPAGYTIDTVVYKADLTQMNTYETPLIIESVNKLSQGTARLVKSSSNGGMTSGNSCYSLTGAVYGVYKTKSDAANNANMTVQLTTASNGHSNTVSLLAGTYYVREIKAPAGYILDTNVYTLNVASGKTTILELKDNPESVSIDIAAAKYDSEKTFDSSGNAPQGSAVFSDAQFTVRFYGGSYKSISQIQSLQPLKTWVLKTDEKGICKMNEDYLVSGDAFYKDGAGNVVLPLGTLTIQETRAPKGYILNNEIYIRTIMSSVNSSSPYVYNYPSVPQKVIRGGVKIQKRDLDTGLCEARQDTTFEGALFDIVNKNAYPVIVSGKTYLPNETVMTIVTDDSGLAQTSVDAIPYGKYKIVETRAPAGYLLEGETEREFSVTQHNVVVDMTTVSNSIYDAPGKGSVSVLKKDSYGKVLEDVVFKLEVYDEDTKGWSAVKTQTTDSCGQAVFEQLDYGRYRITETGTVPGMALLKEPILFKIPYVVAESEDDTGQTPAYAIDGNNYHCDISYTITNDAVAVFPETGGSQNILVVYGIIILFCLIIISENSEKQNIREASLHRYLVRH